MTGARALLAGMVLTTAGLAAIWWPLALIFAGGMLCVGGLLVELDAALPRPGRSEDDEP